MKTLSPYLLRLAAVVAALSFPVHCRGEISQQILHSFGTVNGDGLSSYSGLIQGRDGAYYGTTYYGGGNNAGTVFKINSNGSGYTILRSFLTNGIDGRNPAIGGDLMQGRDGMLYGMTENGGSHGNGTVFKLETDGNGYALIHDFQATDAERAPLPVGSLIQGTDGVLYGVADGRIPHDSGSVFKLDTNGLTYAEIFFNTNGFRMSAGVLQGRDGALYGVTTDMIFKISTAGFNFTVLHIFTNPFGTDSSTNTDGYWPKGPLIQGQDGYLYGTTWEGGTTTANLSIYRYGTIFKIHPTNGTDYAVLHNFAVNNADVHADGVNPVAGLVQGGDGALYGTTSAGDVNPSDGGAGTMFKLNPDGSGYHVVFDFNAGGDLSQSKGWFPAHIIIGSDGAFYGTTAYGSAENAGNVFRLGGNSTRLNSFGANGTDAITPQFGLVQGNDGTLYGTTTAGGNGGFGTVFKVNPNGSGYGVPYRFSGNTNGYFPRAGMILGRDGMLYGTTVYGGNGPNPSQFSAGTVFRLSTDGLSYTAIYRFLTNGIDGRNPGCAPLQTSDGTLYGTTSAGGSNNVGTVFKVNTNGASYAVIYQFKTNTSDGRLPTSGLIRGNDGALYGTTLNGGSNNVGTVFTIHTDGSSYGVLHSFQANGTDGQFPGPSLIQGSDGALYGTTQNGGNDNVGTVFKLNVNGTGYAILHHFHTNDNDGQNPFASVTQTSDGMLYGVTAYGGNSGYDVSHNGYGSIFKLNTNGGDYGVALAFSGADGKYPFATLLLGSDGALYGATQRGGTNNQGTLFRFAPTISGRFTSFAFLPNKTVQFSVNGGSLDYRIDASTNLVSWVTLTNFANTAGTVQFTDRSATNFLMRFYRTVWVQ